MPWSSDRNGANLYAISNQGRRLLQSLFQLGRSRRLRLWLCALLLLCVVAVVLTPGVDLPLRRTRGFRVASHLLLPLAVVALGFTVGLNTYQLQFDLLSSFSTTSHPSASRLFLSSVLLC